MPQPAADSRPPASDRLPWPRAEVVVASLLTLVAVIAHFHFWQSAGGLWRDEASSVGLATLSLSQQLNDPGAADTSPMLFPIVLRLWMRAGASSDAGLRAVGLLIGLASIAALWGCARSLRLRTPLLGLVLLAINPGMIRWGDSLRPYGLGALLGLLVFAQLWRVLENPSVPRILIATLLASAALQATYQAAALLFAASVAAAVVACARRRFRLAAVPLLIGAAASLTLLIDLPQLENAMQWRPLLTSPDAGHGIWGAATDALASGATRWIAALWLILIPLAIVAAARALRERKHAASARLDATLYCLIALLVGVPGLLLVLHLGGLYAHPWHMLLALALTGICLDGLCVTPSAGAVRLAVATALTAFLPPVLFSELSARQTNLDGIAHLLEARVDREDLVLVAPWELGVSFQRYYRGSADWVTLPDLSDRTLHRYDLVKQEMISPQSIAPVLDRMRRTLDAGRRVWVVGRLATAASGDATTPPQSPPQPGSSWYSGDYVSGWEAQAAKILLRDPTAVQALEIDAAPPTQPLEAPRAYLVQGRAR